MYSVGTFVSVDPATYDLVIPEIKSFCDVNIVQQAPNSGSLMIEITGDTLQHCKQLINKIHSLPFVLVVEIIYFYHYDNLESEFSGIGSEAGLSITKAGTNESEFKMDYGSLVHTRH